MPLQNNRFGNLRAICPALLAELSRAVNNRAMADLIVKSVCKSYPTPSDPLVVLDGVDLELSRGESVAIVGPSGSGKSTLLSILGTLDTPTSGSVSLGDADPFSLSEDQLAVFRANQIGFIFQDHHLLPQCTALENVLVPLLSDGSANQEDQTHAEELLSRVGLAERFTHRPAELSGGERQRVAIARSLIRSPQLLLADEPTGNLDQASAEIIASLLEDLSTDQNRMLITVTHSQSLANRMHRCARIESGKLLF